MIDLVSAKNSATRILGFGGLNREALVLETKRKMYRQNPLKRGQVYANIGVDVRQAFYLIADVTTVTVSADVVQFYKDSVEQQVFSKLTMQTTSHDKKKKQKNVSSFAAGQSIYFINKKKIQEGVVQSVLDDLLRVKTSDMESSYVDITSSFHKIAYSDASTLKEVSFQEGANTLKGYIVGHNKKSFVIQRKGQLLAVKKDLVVAKEK